MFLLPVSDIQYLNIKNYETYNRSARVQVWTKSKYLLTISNNFLGLSCSILVYFGLSWFILVHLGASRSVSVYLGLSWSIAVNLGRSILDYLELYRTIWDYLIIFGTIWDYLSGSIKNVWIWFERGGQHFSNNTQIQKNSVLGGGGAGLIGNFPQFFFVFWF